MTDILKITPKSPDYDIGLAMAEGLAAADWLAGDPDNPSGHDIHNDPSRVQDAVRARLGHWFPEEGIAYLADKAIRISKAVTEEDVTPIGGYTPQVLSLGLYALRAQAEIIPGTYRISDNPSKALSSGSVAQEEPLIHLDQPRLAA